MTAPTPARIGAEYERGHADGYAGNHPTPLPGGRYELAAYRSAYVEGYRDGLEAYRRTLEPHKR